MTSLEDLILQADHTNVRLEYMAGFHLWEEGPTLGHQLEVDRIRASITTIPDCIHLNDVLFRFSDGSLTHPDIAILPRTPNTAEMTGVSPLRRVEERQGNEAG